LGWQPGSNAERALQIMATGNLSQAAALGAEAFKPLVELLKNGPPDKQLKAVKALGGMNDPLVIKPLVEALGKSGPAVRIAALGILERFADPSTYNAIERLLKDSNPSVRSAAVEAAARCDGKRAVPALIHSLKDSSWDVRRAAVMALGFLTAPAGVDGLCQVLQDKDHDVRESTAVALGRIGDARATYSLVLALLDTDSAVRIAVANSLQRIDRSWQKSEAAQRTLPKIKAALDHPEYWVRHTAVKLLEQLDVGHDSVNVQMPAQPSVLSTVQQPKQPPHAAFSILADLLHDRDRDLRLAATEAFGQLREKTAKSILTIAAQDDDLLVQQAAQRALAALS
jgi:HEAT repeat protein